MIHGAIAGMQTDFSLKRLKRFCAVARHGGFSAAAEALGIGQSTLSAHIVELEAELRAKLVWRTTRRVRLTPSGKRFLLRAQQRSTNCRTPHWNCAPRRRCSADASFSPACRPWRGQVVPLAIGAFCDRHPGVFVDLIDQPARLVESAVLNGEADLGIGCKPEWVSSLAFEPWPWIVSLRSCEPIATSARSRARS